MCLATATTMIASKLRGMCRMLNKLELDRDRIINMNSNQSKSVSIHLRRASCCQFLSRFTFKMHPIKQHSPLNQHTMLLPALILMGCTTTLISIGLPTMPDQRIWSGMGHAYKYLYCRPLISLIR